MGLSSPWPSSCADDRGNLTLTYGSAHIDATTRTHLDVDAVHRRAPQVFQSRDAVVSNAGGWNLS